MDFKKFKQDVKKENLIIPNMSDKVKYYSDRQEKVYKKERTKINFFPILKYSVLLVPVLIMLLTVSIISISHYANRTDYRMFQIQDKAELTKVLNFSAKYEFDIIFGDGLVNSGFDNSVNEVIPNGPTGEKGEQGNLGSDDYYDTNNQENNVLESDIVKTDGKNIYYYNHKNKAIYVYNTLTKELRSIEVDKMTMGRNQDPLFITDKYIVFLEQYYVHEKNEYMVGMSFYDKNTLEVVYTYRNEGNYIDSRITNNILYYVYNQRDVSELPSDEINGEEQVYEYNDINYSKAAINKGYTYIIAIDLNTLEMTSTVQLGSNNWTTVYATENSIYLAASNSCETLAKYTFSGARFIASKYQTNIFRYELNGINIEYKGLIVTSGFIRDQFYLDEFDNHLRVVLQQHNTLETGNNKLEVYDLNQYANDGTIKKVASLDNGIGKTGEQIKSVRFDDYSCLIVTYLIIDPLYYIDLTNQLKPKITGEYEEPGYNTYLHYINENYAIGFGIDKGYKLGLYKLENQVPEKIDQVDGYSSVSVVDNHKALYIEGEVFGFASSKNIIANDGNYYTNDFIYMYEIYTIDYEGETPKLKLIKEFKLNSAYKYEKMIRIGSDYYLISQLNISKLNSNFDIEEVIRYVNK